MSDALNTILSQRPRLVLIRGLPGSGKSTLAQRFVEAGYKHFEADQHFAVDGRCHFDATRIKEAHYYCRARTRAALAAGHNVVVANTFIRAWEMQPYFDMLAPGAVCVIRAAGQWPNVHGVAHEKVTQMKQNWETYPEAICVG